MQMSKETIKEMVAQVLGNDIAAMEAMADTDYVNALGQFVGALHESIYAHGKFATTTDPSIAVEVAAILAFIKKG